MNLNEYQEKARRTAIYPSLYKILYPTLGLCGEAGEVSEKVKKSIRDGVKPDTKEKIALELGDVLWYLANLAKDLGYSLEWIATRNLTKLASRFERGKLQGSGDER